MNEERFGEFALALARHEEHAKIACKGKIEAMDEVLTGTNNVTRLEVANN